MDHSALKLQTTPVTPLRSRLAIGGGSALFVDGRCVHPGGALGSVEIAAGGRVIPALGWGMAPPRMHGEDYWWAIIPLPADLAPGTLDLALRATDLDGTVAAASLGSIELEREDPSPAGLVPLPEPGDGPLVAICMATYEPEIEKFRAQVESIRTQSHSNWICLISDDASAPEALAKMRAVVGDDRRFQISAAAENRGFYANFERALRMVPEGAEFIALSDQDDLWRPDKLERLLAGLAPEASLVFSDMRITAPGGTVIADTYWGFRANNYTDLGSLVLANTVTGAAALFRADLLADVLPFPPRHGGAFHDHWIAQVALALGPISYVDAPLYDYVQHEEAALGYLQANGFGRYSAPVRERIGIWYGRWSGRGFRLGWRVPYFRLYCRVRLATTALRLRLGDRISPDKREVLAAIDDSPAGIAWLARRSLRDLRGPTETIGRERVMLAGFAWRRAAEARRRTRAALSRAR